jgi:hypothetical protein
MNNARPSKAESSAKGHEKFTATAGKKHISRLDFRPSTVGIGSSADHLIGGAA